ALARKFRAAKPFRHVVIDKLVDPGALARMQAEFAVEPQVLLQDEIYLHLRSNDPPAMPALCAFRDALSDSCAVVSQICATKVSRADGSACAYLPGHYLLPHSDARRAEGRSIAYAFYIAAPRQGGELEFF